MMMDRRAPVLLTLLAMAVSQAFAQSRPAAVDAGGRPVVDDRGRRIVHRTAPTVLSEEPRAMSAGASPFTASAKPRGQRTQHQSTGISPSYYETWRSLSWGVGIGATGFWPVDADNDGDLDLVVGGGTGGFGANMHWSIVSFDADRGEYQIVWQSGVTAGSEPIRALTVVEHANTKRVWVARDDGQIEVVDLMTRETVDTLTAPAAVTSLAVADADNDGSVDVLGASGSGLFIYDPATLALKRTLPQSGQRVAVANVDGDSRLEIVLNSGVVLDVDGTTVTEQWNTTAFGARIALADIDDDGMAELVAAEAWETIRAWDLDTQSLTWSITADLDIAALRLIDVAGDATPEIVYGDGQWGAIHVLDAATRSELWSIDNPDHGITDIAVADIDGDGAREIFWGAGHSSTGADYLHVYDMATRTSEWRSVDFNGPYQAVGMADIDLDGQVELVVASFQSESGYEDGLIMVFDAATRQLEWRSSTALFDRPVTGVHALQLVNVDDDPQLEIVVGTDQLYDGAMYIVDGLTHARQLQGLYDDGSPLNVLDAADLTGDGRPEILAGNTVAHTGSPGVFLYVIDPATGGVIWRSASIGTGFRSVTDVLVADVGGAGIDLIGVAASAVHVIRWSDRRHLTSAANDYLSVTAADVTGSAAREILAGRGTGAVDVLDGETLAILDTHTICSNAIDAIQMHGPTQLVLTCANRLVIYDLGSRTIVDETPAMTTGLGLNAGLAQGVVNGRATVLTSGLQAVAFADLSDNHPPVIVVPQGQSVHWRGSIDLQLTATDADGDPVRFQLASAATLGRAVWLDPVLGTLRYTSTGVGIGTDGILVQAFDGLRYSEPQTLRIEVTNTAPSTSTAQYLINGRTPVRARFSAQDPHQDPLTFSVVQPPAHGTLTFEAATGVFEYVPSAAGRGTDIMIFAASDGLSETQGTVQFRYPEALPSSGRGGGGNFGAVLLIALLPIALRARRARP